MAKNPKNNSGCCSAGHSEGNFGTGLFLGVVAGALGMFLFGTDRGQELMENLKQELEKENDQGETPIEQTRTLIAQVVAETKNMVNETRESVQEKVNQASEEDLFPKFQRKH